MSEEIRLPLQRLALVFCLLALFLFSYHNGEISLHHTDEQYYTQSCRTMAEGGDWFTPRLNGEERFAKPILFYWPVALSFKIFGVSLSSARFVSSLFGALGLWVTFRLGTSLFGARAGLYAPFILASSYLYFLSARLAYTDMMLCFFITLALFFFSRILQEKGSAGGKNILFFYVAAGLATATKGPPGFLLPGFIAAAYLGLTRDRGTARRFFHVPGMTVFLLLSLFWPVSMALLHGDAFLHHLILAEGKDRIFHAGMPGLYFFGVLLRYFFPWSLFLLAAAFTAFGKERGQLRSKERFQLFLWAWIGVPVILFTLLRIEHSRYMLPAAPAAALLLGYYFQRWTLGAPFRDRGFFLSFRVVLILYFVLATVTFLAGCLLYYLRWKGASPEIFLVPAVFLMGAGGMLYSRRRGDWTLLPIILAFPLLVTLPFFAGKFLPMLNPDPMMAFAESINSGWKPGAQAGTYRFGNGNERLRILTGRPVESLETEEDLHAFLQRKGPLFLVIEEKDFARLPEALNLGLGRLGEARKWKKIRLNRETWAPMWAAFSPGFQEGFKEKVLLVYKN